jgi:CheY-like chemotaxis protein
MKILIIDDDSDQRAALGILLRALGHEVVLAADGPAGLAAAAVFLPTVVFLDYRMPHADGFETARALRRLVGASGMRVVMLTGSPEVTGDEASLAGCDALIMKPARLSSVLAALHAAHCSAVQELGPVTAQAPVDVAVRNPAAL